MNIRIAQREDVAQMLEIYNDEVLNGTATFDLSPHTLSQRMAGFEAHNVDNHPLIVAEADGKVAGYASLSTYREKEAYKSTVELSIYVSRNFRRQGVASQLMQAILDLARRDENTYVVVSVITEGNQASVNLHNRFGFTYCGTLHQVGRKFGRLLDVEMYELNVQ